MCQNLSNTYNACLLKQLATLKRYVFSQKAPSQIFYSVLNTPLKIIQTYFWLAFWSNKRNWFCFISLLYLYPVIRMFCKWKEEVQFFHAVYRQMWKAPDACCRNRKTNKIYFRRKSISVMLWQFKKIGWRELTNIPRRSKDSC